MSPTTKSSIGSRSRPSRTQRDNTLSAVDVGVVVDHSQESVSTALVKGFCQLTVPGHGRGHQAVLDKYELVAENAALAEDKHASLLSIASTRKAARSTSRGVRFRVPSASNCGFVLTPHSIIVVAIWEDHVSDVRDVQQDRHLRGLSHRGLLRDTRRTAMYSSGRVRVSARLTIS